MTEVLDRTEALRTARMAEAAYLADAESKAWLESSGWREIQQFDVDHSQAYLCRNDDTLSLVIRGSDEFADWRRNLKATVRTWADPDRKWMGRVHRGFKQSYDAFDGQLSGPFRLHALAPGIKRREVIGHSLGAAVTVFEAFIALAGRNIDAVWLFGCPPPGNRRFAHEYDLVLGDRTINVRNHNDLVTLSPFWNHRVGRQFYLDGRGGVIYDPCWLRRAAGQAKRLWRAVRRHEVETEHPMYRYVESLEGLK